MALSKYVKLDEYGLYDSHGDTIWMTSLHAIAHNAPELLENIKKHCITKKENGKFKFWRRPERVGKYDIENDDTSRDQLTMFFVAMKLLGVMDKKYLNVGWRISKKFRCTPDFWLWKESLRGGVYGWFMALLFGIVSGVWMVFISKQQNTMEEAYNLVSWRDWVRTPDDQLTSQQITFNESRFPDYATHLYSWQVYSSVWTPFKSLLQYNVEQLSYPENLLIMAHLGKDVTRKDVDDFPRVSSWVWQRRPTESMRMYNFKIFDTEEEFLNHNPSLRAIVHAVLNRRQK